MRVLQLSWEYEPVIAGGLGRHVQMLSRSLADSGLDVDAVVRGPQRGARADERDAGVEVHRVATAPFPHELEAFLRWVGALNTALAARARTLVADRRPDLVHSHDWLVAAAGREVARATGVPWVVTVHATEHGRHAGRVSRRPQSTIHAAERAMARDADHVITCSDWMRGHVADVFGVPSRRITALRNGIDVTALSVLHGDPRRWRARLSPDGERVVLLVGRLVYEKGFDIALEALAQMDGVRCAIAGTGPDEARLRAQVRSSESLRGRVTFLGWTGDAELHSLYRAADVCVVPSRFEPFGIVALEAMASRCPCVVSDTGGLREIVPSDETVGLRVTCGDTAALARAMTRVLDDDALRARMGAAGPARAGLHDWGRVALETRRVYERALVEPAA